MIAALTVLVGFLALCAMGYGALEIFAGGMSDDISAGREAGSAGAWMLGGGFLVLCACIAFGIWHR